MAIVTDRTAQRTYAGIPIEKLVRGIQALQADLIALDRESRERHLRVQAMEYRATRENVADLTKRQAGRYGLLERETRELARCEARVTWFETYAPAAVRLAKQQEEDGVAA